MRRVEGDEGGERNLLSTVIYRSCRRSKFSKVEGRSSRRPKVEELEGRRSKVEGRRSKVEGRRSKGALHDLRSGASAIGVETSIFADTIRGNPNKTAGTDSCTVPAH